MNIGSTLLHIELFCYDIGRGGSTSGTSVSRNGGFSSGVCVTNS